MKNIIIALFTFTTLILTSFNSYAWDHRRHNSVSITLGSQLNGISLNYNPPIRHRHHRSNLQKERHLFNHKSNHVQKYQQAHRNILRHGQNQSLRYFQTRQKQPVRFDRQIAFNSKHSRQHKSDCHPVRKTVTDRHNRYKEIGGTMCYDKSGQGYIVAGSRYRIR